MSERKPAVDVYTLAHFVYGLAMKSLGATRFQNIMLHSVYEFVSNSPLFPKIVQLTHQESGGLPDSIENSFADTVAAVLGWEVA
jgi:hypothetical protein